MKTVTRTIPRVHYLLGEINTAESRFTVKEDLVRPVDMTDRKFKKYIKDTFPNLVIITTKTEEISYTCSMADFIELCEESCVDETKEVNDNE